MFDPEDFADVDLSHIPPWWFLPRKVTAQVLGVTRQALATNNHRGHDPAPVPQEHILRPQGRVFYRVSDILQWLDGTSDPAAYAREFLDHRGVGEPGEALDARAYDYDRHCRGRRAKYEAPKGLPQPRVHPDYRYIDLENMT